MHWRCRGRPCAAISPTAGGGIPRRKSSRGTLSPRPFWVAQHPGRLPGRTDARVTVDRYHVAAARAAIPMSVSQGFSSRRFPSANDSSPAIWRCTRARSRASATASWATRRRTAATSSGGDHPVINRRMNMGDAMMNRPLIARLETVLRHRQRNTRKQRSQKGDNLQGGHLHTLLTPKLTQTPR
jgi:hypothetical protein